jgi:hypothetical protein
MRPGWDEAREHGTSPATPASELQNAGSPSGRSAITNSDAGTQRVHTLPQPDRSGCRRTPVLNGSPDRIRTGATALRGTRRSPMQRPADLQRCRQPGRARPGCGHAWGIHPPALGRCARADESSRKAVRRAAGNSPWGARRPSAAPFGAVGGDAPSRRRAIAPTGRTRCPSRCESAGRCPPATVRSRAWCRRRGAGRCPRRWRARRRRTTGRRTWTSSPRRGR